MSLQSFMNRFINADTPNPNTPPVVEFGGMEDHEMDTVVSSNAVQPKPRHVRHSGFVAVIGSDPQTVLADGWLIDPRENGNLPATQENLRAFDLPTSSHAVMSLLYNLEYADLILYNIDFQRGLTTEHLRWITRLQGQRTPVVVLLNGTTRSNQKHLASTVQMMEMQINPPIVPIYNEDYPQTRASLMEVVYRISPRLAALLAIRSPLLRPVLAQHMLSKSVHTSMSLHHATEEDEDMSSLAEEQVRLIRQIRAVYGQGTRLTRREYTGLVSMVGALTGYSNEMIDTLPAMKEERRERLANSVSTLMVGYITMVYHGETPPEIRSQLLPEIWRLYRATGQMADA